MQESKPISKTDWDRVDAMTDADIVYDDDTGPPVSEAFVLDAEGFRSSGLSDFQKNIKLHTEK